MRRPWHLLAAAAAVLVACSPRPEPPADEAERAGAEGEAAPDRLLDVYLIGDGGRPAPRGDPVLIAARRMAAQAPERSLVIFLGDNLYPDGLPDEPGPRRAAGERILQAQLDVPLQAGARGIFVPGNHDWDHSGPQGWAEAMLQERYIEAHGRGRVESLPGGGCPGPAVRDFAAGLRVIALNTQWWLQRYDKPQPPPDVCPAVSDSTIVAAIRAALRDAAGRPVLVVAHHPLVSGGTHGVFPLLPTRYSPEPKFSPQDLGHPRYQHMRRVLQRAFAANPPLVFAAGHDHNLQLLHGVGTRYQIVSGTGIYGHTGRVRKLPGTIYGEAVSGFMRLSLLRDGRVHLDVFAVDAAARSRRAFARVLTPAK